MNSTRISDVTKIQRQPIPIVAPGAGATLADVWVEKLVAQWLVALRHDASYAERKCLAFFGSPLGRISGNPKGQQRWAQRAAEAIGPALLEVSVDPFGKRGNFGALVDWARPMPSILSTDPTNLSRPANWLCGVRMHIAKHGVTQPGHGDNVKISKTMPGALSRHALVRLIQRGGCHESVDLQRCLRAAWSRIAAAEYFTRETRKRPPGVWLVPARLPTASEPVALVATNASLECAFPDSFIVKTVLRMDMLTPSQREAVMRLDHAMGAHRIFELLGTPANTVIEALEGARVKEADR